MAEVNKYQTGRLFQLEEYLNWDLSAPYALAGAGNFTGICAVSDPFDPGVDLCQVTQTWFSDPVSPPHVGSLPHITVRKIRSDGRGMNFFIAILYVK
jgi:hypothetical protein